ncbi:hypothetical protein TALC_00134 [Thermoplasmatales archaeon BRNA1]|nr:hypothetical protein TALC_00134 [Thermoplasmatales archaeon BRNA1]
MVNMEYVGRSKYDNNGRITILREIAELMNLEKGEDYVSFFLHEGRLIVKKDTKKYGTFDFEGDEIADRLRDYEENLAVNFPVVDDPEEAERIAREQYERDKKLRESAKNKRDIQ